jgi:hypothetical protein
MLKFPTKNVIMPAIDVTIDLTEKQFTELHRAASILQLPDLSFVVIENNIVATVSNTSDPTTNKWKVIVHKNWNGPNFIFNFKLDNLKILPGDYQVNFGKNIVGEFVNKNISLKYWFAMEANTSKYDS